jgi:hypothetical protein
MTRCSPTQRRKADAGSCRVCGVEHCDPAHVVDRSLGGCQDEDCVVPLCRSHHRLYDEGVLDLLPYLDLREQGHAAGHIGLSRALWRTTNERAA